MSILNLQPDNILTQIYEEKKDTHSHNIQDIPTIILSS